MLKGLPSLSVSALCALAVLTASASLSACRLGANNSEKLTALKSGEIYDEDGLLTVAITSPAPATLINLASVSNAYAVSGSCSPDAAEIVLTIDEVPVSTSGVIVCSQGLWSSTFDASALSDGAHAVSATLNRNGKTKTSEAVSFTKDVAVPQLAILSPSNGGFINASSDSATFALSGTCTEAGQAVSVLVDDATASSQSGGSCNGTTWAATISTLGLSAGAHSLRVSITNASGNSKTSEAVVVTKDVVTPTAAISTPANNSYVNIGNNSASFAVSGTCNDPTASVQVKVDGVNSGTAALCGGVNWNATISTLALSQGAHTLAASITDPAGNSAASSAITVTKDTSAPAIAITSPTASSSINIGNNSASFSIQGSCTTATENGRTITIQVNGTNATQSAIACGASDSWSGTINTVSLGQGAHTLTAVLADVAGNSSTSTGIAVTKDTSAPTVTLTYPVSNLIINPVNNATTFSVKGACSENSRAVTILVDGAAASGVASNTCSSGAFSATIDVTGLSNASHTISATHADAAGNSNASNPSVTVTKNSLLSMDGTFSRASEAIDPYTAVTAASGVLRYTTVGGSTGVFVEESTTNLMSNTNGRPSTMIVTGTTPPTVAVVSDSTNPFGTEAYQVTFPGSGTTGFAGSRATSNSWSTTAAGVYSQSVWVKGDTTGIYIYHTGSQGFGQMTASGRTINGWAEFVKEKVTATATSTNQYLAVYAADAAAWGKTIYIGASQVEQKLYHTNYAASGSRAADLLTVPTAGSIQASQGAVVIRAYVDGDLLTSGNTNQEHVLWAANHASDAFYIYRAWDSWRATSKNAAGTRSDAIRVANSSPLTAGWHIFGMRWSSTELSVWIDGVKGATPISNPNLPTTLPSTMSIGTLPDSTFAWSQPIDYAAFYQHAPSDSEMTSYTSTGPVKADNRLDFNGVTLNRGSIAHGMTNGAQVASGAPRFATIAGRTGLLLEEATTNLLSANMSNVEADTSGFNVTNAATIARITTWAWEGTASLRVQNADGIGAVGNSVQVGSFSVTSGQTYAGSFYAYNPNASSITISAGIAGNINTTVSLAAGETKRITFTYTANVTGATTLRFMEATGQTFYVDGMQVENKAFATSWHIGGGTRATETLTFPISRYMPTSSWTIELAYIPRKPISSYQSHGTSTAIFQVGTYHSNSSLTIFNYWANPTAGVQPRLTLGVRDQAAASWSIDQIIRNTADNWYVPDTVYRVAVRCTGNNTFHHFFNGTKSSTFTVPNAITSWAGTEVRIGGIDASQLNANSIIDEVRISNVARSDADLEAYTLGNSGLSWDSSTTIYLPFDGSLGQ